MSGNSKGSLKPKLALALVCFLTVFLAASWVYRHGYLKRPLTSDAAIFRLKSQLFIEEYEAGGIGAWFAQWLDHEHSHGPIVHIVGSAVGILDGAGMTPWTCFLTTSIFAVILAIGVYRLARQFGSDWFAVGVVTLTMTFGITQTWMRTYYLDLPVQAMAVWALDALIRSRWFQSAGWSMAFGLFSGLAMLTKLLAPVYWLPWGACAMLAALVTSGMRARALRNALLSALAFALVTLPWFARNLATMQQKVDGVVYDDTRLQRSPVGELDTWLYYPVALFNNGWGAAFVLLTITAVIYRLLTRDVPEDRLPPTEKPPALQLPWVGTVLSCSMIISYLMITTGHAYGQTKYYIHFMYLGALFFALVVRGLPTALLRRTFVVLAALVVVWNVLNWQRHWYQETREDQLAIGKLQFIPNLNTLWQFTNGAEPYRFGISPWEQGEGWSIAEFCELMRQESRQEEARVVLVTTPATKYSFFSPMTFQCDLLQQNEEGISMAPPLRIGGEYKGELQRRLNAGKNIEFMIFFKRDLPAVEDLLVRTDCKLEPIHAREITPVTTVVLARILRVAPRGRFVTSLPSEAEGVQPLRTTYVNGWMLLGYRVDHLASGRVSLTTVWDLRDLEGAIIQVNLQKWSDRSSTAQDSHRVGPPSSPDGRYYRYESAPLEIPDAEPGDLVFTLRLFGLPQGGEPWNVKVDRTGLKRWHSAAVVLPLGSPEEEAEEQGR